jgi:hypothetical protein
MAAGITDHVWSLDELRKLTMRLDYEAQHSKVQRTFVDFLNVELKLGHTFMQSALLASEEGHMDRYADAKEKATAAAASVRRFMCSLDDGNSRNEIARRLSELDQLISTL